MKRYIFGALAAVLLYNGVSTGAGLDQAAENLIKPDIFGAVIQGITAGAGLDAAAFLHFDAIKKGGRVEGLRMFAAYPVFIPIEALGVGWQG